MRSSRSWSGPLVILLSGAFAGSAFAQQPPIRGETVIEPDDTPPPPATPPESTYYNTHHSLPYSDAAILSDVRGLAWMLIEVDTTGKVSRAKFLKRPGYDLDEIALAEVWKLRFSPGRDAQGRPVVSRGLWRIEWENASLKEYTTLSSRLFYSRGTVCAGSGRPLNLDYQFARYRDCSPPDWSMAAREPWFYAPATR